MQDVYHCNLFGVLNIVYNVLNVLILVCCYGVGVEVEDIDIGCAWRCCLGVLGWWFGVECYSLNNICGWRTISHVWHILLEWF